MSARDPTPLRGPRIRKAAIPPYCQLIIRGDDLDPATDLRQADAFKRRYPDWGRYGLSAYYAGSQDELNDLAFDQLERFARLEIFDREELVQNGFDVVPTFRTPHVTIAFAGEAIAWLGRLRCLRRRLWTNPYHEPEPSSSTRKRQNERRT